MKVTVESLIQQGNDWFLAGNKKNAMKCYYKALEQSGALLSVVSFVQKNTDTLFEEKEMLHELLHKKYHILLVSNALDDILKSIGRQLEINEIEKALPQFKKLILAKHPTTPEQFIDVFLDQFENESWGDIILLSHVLREQGFDYDVCDTNQLCYDRRHARDLKRFEHSLQGKKTYPSSKINEMTGHEFEDFLIDLFTRLGYRVERNKIIHEQGLDFLLERHGERIACQVKRYNKPVGNKAVQEVIAAKDYYRCHKALVVTNSRFTASAKQLAERCNVELWDGKKLKEKIKSVA